jgi:secondary thiamine-phosphate synthase enzyme
MLSEIGVRTGSRTELIDITRRIEAAIADSGVTEGFCRIFVPHTTAAVTINEKADPDVARDIDAALAKLVPESWGFRHREGNSDAHVKSSLVGAHELVLVSDGRAVLGTWQAVFFCEFDGPRSRRCYIQVTGS